MCKKKKKCKGGPKSRIFYVYQILKKKIKKIYYQRNARNFSTSQRKKSKQKKVKNNISYVLEMFEMDNAKGIFEKSSADQNDKHEFKIFQSYALKYNKKYKVLRIFQSKEI